MRSPRPRRGGGGVFPCVRGGGGYSRVDRLCHAYCVHTLLRTCLHTITRQWSIVALKLCQRRRRWPNIKTTLGQRLSRSDNITCLHTHSGYWSIVVLIVGQRRRRWASIKKQICQCLVLALNYELSGHHRNRQNKLFTLMNLPPSSVSISL